MAYSGTQTFNLSLEEIIQEAHERCQLEVREGYDLKTAKRSLNLMFAEWANRGLNLWTIEYATQTLTATDAVSFAITTGAVATPLTFTTGVGSCTITGTQTQHSAAATDSFTVTATDAEGQTAARAFTMTWSFESTGGAQFN